MSGIVGGESGAMIEVFSEAWMHHEYARLWNAAPAMTEVRV
ncbi:MAG: hypothetical protein WBQ37_01495 [Candidatus Competibacter sp.]